METDQLIINLLIVVFGTLSLRAIFGKGRTLKKRIFAGSVALMLAYLSVIRYQHWQYEQTPEYQQHLRELQAQNQQWEERRQAEARETQARIEDRLREIHQAANVLPYVGAHLCDNQDGHYRGVVASIHQVNSDTVGPYTAYKLTNGQVAAEAIIRVCTNGEER